LESIGKKLNIEKWEDWYSISKSNIIRNGGAGLLDKYGGSPSKLISSVFKSKFNWNISHFESLPHNYWNDPQNQYDKLESIGKKLKIEKWEDWYSISQSDIIKNGGVGLLYKYCNSPSKLITTVFENKFNWNISHI